MNKWAVIVQSAKGKDNQIKKFETWEEANGYLEKVKELESHYKFKAHIVSLLKPFPPDENKNYKKGQLWCPYCSEYRKFKTEDKYKKCEVCRVSTEDFWTKTYNKLWR